MKCNMKYNCVCMLSWVPLFATPRTVACQASWSMRFARQEYWSMLSSPPPEDLPDPGIEPATPVSTTLAGRFLYHWATWEIIEITFIWKVSFSEGLSFSEPWESFAKMMMSKVIYFAPTPQLLCDEFISKQSGASLTCFIFIHLIIWVIFQILRK